MANELLTWPGSSPTAVSDYQAQNTILAAVIAGFMRLSLTEWATSAIPQIAAGSIVEVGGSLYSFTSAVSIAGTPADGAMYIRMEPSGSDANPTWSSVAPSWDMAKNGWYSGSYRYVAKMTRSGSSYTDKELYTNYPNSWIYSSMIQAGQIQGGQYGSRSIASSDIALLAIVAELIGTGAVTQAKLGAYTAGNYEVARHAGGSNDTATPTAVIRYQLPRVGTLRVTFSLATSHTAHNAYARVYRNGTTAVGTARSTMSLTPVEFSEDVSGWSIGDTLEIKAYNDYGSVVSTVSAVEISCGFADFPLYELEL